MISVLIVSHDGRDHLRHCLAQLAAQPGSHGEVIVVDNASGDGSAELVRDRFPDVRLLVLEENVGFGAANNRAAALARGDHVLLLNSDAWPAEGALERLAARLDGDPKLAAVTPELYYPDGRRQFAWAPQTGVFGEALQLLRNRFESRAWAHGPMLRRLLGPIWCTAACLLVRKTAFEEVGGFDEEFFLYFEDVDLSRRLRLAGWRLAVEAGARAYHVKGGSQQDPRPAGGRGELEYRRSQLRYYAKHRPAWENRLLRLKLRRKFVRVRDNQLRRDLLALLDRFPRRRETT